MYSYSFGHFADAPNAISGSILFVAGFAIGLGIGLYFWYRKRPPVPKVGSGTLPRWAKNTKISDVQRQYGDADPDRNPYYSQRKPAKNTLASFFEYIKRMMDPSRPLSDEAKTEILARVKALKTETSQPTAKEPTYTDKDYEQPENKTETS